MEQPIRQYLEKAATVKACCPGSHWSSLVVNRLTPSILLYNAINNLSLVGYT